MGLEPTTPCLQSRCSSQLSYSPGTTWWFRMRSPTVEGEPRRYSAGHRRTTAKDRHTGTAASFASPAPAPTLPVPQPAAPGSRDDIGNLGGGEEPAHWSVPALAIKLVGRLSDGQRMQWEQQGFVRIERFAEPGVGTAMLERVGRLVRAAAAGDDVGAALVLPEQQPDFSGESSPTDVAPEQLASKVFRVARFEPARPIVGLWLAVTRATLENGCLHVLPGSQREPEHEHVPDPARERQLRLHRDRRPRHDRQRSGVDGAGRPARVRQPSDAPPTDNASRGIRAAMVFHVATRGTVDSTEQQRGYTVNDRMPVRSASTSAPTR
jgi:Phytanoyl-CoA dioxygenase (PhyH)